MKGELTSWVGDVGAGRPDQECSLRALVSSPVSLGYEGRWHSLVISPHSDLALSLILATLRAGNLPATWSRQRDGAVGLRLPSVL